MSRGVVAMALIVVLGLGLAVAQEKPADTPVLTEVQSLKLQLLDSREQTAQTQLVLIQQALQKVREDRAALLADLEKAHPGWTINRTTMQWERAPVSPAKK